MAAKARELALQGANGQGASGLAAPGTSTTAALYTDNGAGSSASTAGAQEAGRLMEFCETIIKAVGKIDRALKQSKRGEAVLKTLRVDVNGGNSREKNGAAASDGDADNADADSAKYEDLTEVSDEQLKKTYVEWASEARYAEYNWEVEPAEGVSTSELGPSYKHTYSKEAKSISSYPGRNVAIMKEVGPHLDCPTARWCGLSLTSECGHSTRHWRTTCLSTGTRRSSCEATLVARMS